MVEIKEEKGQREGHPCTDLQQRRRRERRRRRRKRNSRNGTRLFGGDRELWFWRVLTREGRTKTWHLGNCPSKLALYRPPSPARKPTTRLYPPRPFQLLGPIVCVAECLSTNNLAKSGGWSVSLERKLLGAGFSEVGRNENEQFAAADDFQLDIV